MKKEKRIIEGKELELTEWLEVISKPPPGCSVVDHKFPTDVHLDEYIRSIGQRSEKEVKDLLTRTKAQLLRGNEHTILVLGLNDSHDHDRNM